MQPRDVLKPNLVNCKSLQAFIVDVTYQDGDVAKMSVLLSKRAEVLFSIDAKDPQTGNTAIMLASQHGHHKVTTVCC